MTKIFTSADQLAFAKLSGDYNPIHIDPVAARRFMFGRPVAHGIHVVLWALNQLLATAPQRPLAINSITASFRSPIIENEPVELSIGPLKASRHRLDVSANGVKLATIVVSFEENSATKSAAVRPVAPVREGCEELTAGELSSVAGRVALSLERCLAETLFPIVMRMLPYEQIATLLATTRLVGMKAPGLHSLFTGLELNLTSTGDSNELTYHAENFDERFSMLTMAVDAPGLSGRVSAALRPAPKKQASMIEIRQIVTSDEFIGEKVLVIGGSRGLGEVAVKEWAAGSAEVYFTYHSGQTDARRIVDEVSANGGKAESFAFDVSKDHARLPSLLHGWSPTLLCYFATPFIFSATAGRFSQALFRQFCDCYVEGFIETFNAVRLLSPQLRGVLYPSSSALDQMPSNMGEYSAAKAAAESVCGYLGNLHPKIRFLTPRLPRLPTDQTASLLTLETADPAVIILDLLRKLRS